MARIRDRSTLARKLWASSALLAALGGLAACQNQRYEDCLSYLDKDLDGYGDGELATAVVVCDPPEGYADNADDCDDNDSALNPGVPEVCDGVDNNCSGESDEGVTISYYVDLDGDGYGDMHAPKERCTPLEGELTQGGDCDDSDAAVSPDASEVCDDRDNDCNGSVDEGLTTTYYRDSDWDGYGSDTDLRDACSQPDGYLASAGDCDDQDAEIHPGAGEVCDGVDNDCDGSLDGGAFVTVKGDLQLSDSSADYCEDKLCPVVIEGYLDFTRIDGSVDLSCVYRVDDYVETYNGGTKRVIDLSGLTIVGGDLVLLGQSSSDGPGNTRELDLSSLEEVGGATTIGRFPELTELDLSTLETVGAHLSMKGNEELTDLNLRGLSSVGDWIAIMDNPELCDSDLSYLYSVDAGGSVTIDNDGC